ncbi:MAG: thioredoxin [Planctomycetota bacterium]
MASAVINITDDNFKTEVMNATSQAVLLDFYATWCGPCKVIAPVLEELATKYAGQGLKVGKVDIDVAQKLATDHSIISVPTLMFFKGGKMVDKIVGAPSKAVLENKLKTMLG